MESPELQAILLGIIEVQPLDGLLRRLARTAHSMTDADYAAIGAYDQSHHLEHFEPFGMTAEERAPLPHPPHGVGLLGQFAGDPRVVQLADFREHATAVGFPPHHPPMEAFLGVPLILGERVLGAFYVTRRPGRAPFGDEERVHLEALAPYAALAIHNARALESEQRERESAEALERYAMRDEIARDLHDDIIQAIYAVGLGLHVARVRDTVSKDEALDRAAGDLNAVIADLRAYIDHLTDGEAPPDGLLAARLRAIFQAPTAAAWEVTIDLGGEALDPALERSLYLVTRELISNVERHARAQRASLLLRCDAEGIRIEVHDDGTGFDRRGVTPEKVGLRSVEQRVADLGGSLIFETAMGAGTRVSAQIPIPMRMRA